MLLLVPAHPSCPGQNPDSHKMVVVVQSLFADMTFLITVVKDVRHCGIMSTLMLLCSM